jgi:hypothetical protein
MEELQLKKCGLTSLEERRVRGDLLIETFKLVKGLERVPATTFFSKPPGNISSRGQ